MIAFNCPWSELISLRPAAASPRVIETSAAIVEGADFKIPAAMPVPIGQPTCSAITLDGEPIPSIFFAQPGIIPDSQSIAALTAAADAFEAESERAARDGRRVNDRLTLTPEEAADALGVSRDFFDDHVKPELRVVRRGRLVLIPVRELERWVDESASRTLDERRAA